MALGNQKVPVLETGRLDNFRSSSGSGLPTKGEGSSTGSWMAMITTLVTRHAQASQATLVWHMSKFNFNFQQQFAHIQSSLANNTGNWAATKKSLAVLYGILEQQSALLSYVYGFRFCVLVCLVCAALALLFKKVAKPTARSRSINDVREGSHEHNVRTK